MHNRTQCPVRDETATNVALKVALENCVAGRIFFFKFNEFNKVTTASLFPLSFYSVLAAWPRRLSQASESISVKGQNLSALTN